MALPFVQNVHSIRFAPQHPVAPPPFVGGRFFAEPRAPAHAAAMRAVVTELLANAELYREVVLRRIASARESVLISTANVKEMFVEVGGSFKSIVEVFNGLAARGVELRVLH